MRIHALARFVLSLICTGFVGNAISHGVGSSFTEDLIMADFIFKGEVIDVSYRNSTPLHARNPALAHSFVTYRIETIFKGSIAPPDPASGARSDPPGTTSNLTLRFLGGAAGEDEYEMVFGNPLFDVGDIDVLMISGNGSSTCPLLRCLHSRYRIIEGFMYGDDGQEIVSTAEASVRYGKFHHLRDVLVNQVGTTQLVRVGEVELNETGMQEPLPDFGIHHSAESFTYTVEQELAALLAAGILVPPDPIHSQDIDAIFSVDLAEPAPISRKALENNRADLGVLVSDHIEHWLLKYNDGNPILNKRQSTWLNRFRTHELKRLNRKEIRRERRHIHHSHNGHRSVGQ